MFFHPGDDAFEGGFDLVQGGGVADAQGVAAAVAEGFPGDRADAGFAQQFERHVATVDAFRQRREQIEGAIRPVTGKVRCGLHQVHQPVAAALVFHQHVVDEGALAAQCRHPGPLAGGVGHGGGEHVVAAQFLDRALAGHQPADAHARHAEGFRETGDHHHMVQVRAARQHARVLLAVVHQMVVDLIADHVHAPVGRFLHDRFHGVAGIDGAGGVAWRVEHDGVGVRADGVDHFLRVQLVLVLRVRGDRFHHAAVHADQRRVEHERGLRHDELPARRRGGGERQIQRLCGAGGDHDVFRHQGAVVAFPVVFRQGFQQLGQAGVHRVAGLARVQGVHRRFHHMLRRLQVRLPDGQMDHVLHGRRQVHHAADARHRDGQQGRVPDRVFGFVEVRVQVDAAHITAPLLKTVHAVAPARASDGRSVKGRSCSNKCPALSTCSSAKRRPTICSPMGRPSPASPSGTDSAGWPVMLKG